MKTKAGSETLVIEMKVESKDKPAELYVDGKLANEATGESSKDSSVQIIPETSDVWVIKFAAGVFFVWDRGDAFKLMIDDEFFRGDVEGLCGNSDGKASNDLKGPVRTASNDAQFFSAWAIGEEVSF